MDLHHRSCVLPSNAPALSEPEAYIPSRVLQERSANRLHEYSDASSRKRSPTPLYAGRLGGYFTGNITTHFNSDKSEAQVEIETKRLLKLLKNCDKYQKYRDRQPSDNANAKGEKDQRWPDNTEIAFFRALVRWPPMGRRKQMLDGQLRGRNELVADSIERDTGEPRTRKQVSSHIQVLKPMLADQPQILVYMSTEDMSGRSSRGRHASSHFRHRHASSKYGHSQGDSDLHHSLGYLPSSVALAKIQAGHEESPFTVGNFDMFCDVASIRAHTFSQISNSRSRLDDLHVTDINSWRKQYPEFRFLQTDEFRDIPVLVCDATMKIMTSKLPPGADLSITFDLFSKHDLSVYDSIEGVTRFFENGKLAEQPEGEGRETRRRGGWSEHGCLKVYFGSGFWALKLRRLGNLLGRASANEELGARTQDEEMVRGELQNLTAVQHIYGVRDNEEVCLLTILWRFSQTKTSQDAGRMTWRVANFGSRREQKWVKGEGLWLPGVKEEELEHIRNAKELIPVSHDPSSLSMLSMPTASHSMYPALPLEYPHPFGSHPPQLDLDTLALEGLAPSDYSHPTSASSLATDYSQAHSLPPLSHSQDTVGISQSQDFQDANDFDFNGGHITISGCLEPAINLGAYESYNASHLNAHANTTLPNLSSITGLDSQHALNDFDLSSLATMNASMPPNCYATKPSWQHSNLISHLENAAEQFGVADLMVDDGQAGLMGDAGLWKLQAGFGADTGVGAEGRRDSKVSGVVDFGERERGVWRM